MDNRALRQMQALRQGIKRDWTYLKLWHRNSRLPMKSVNQGGGGGCARVLSIKESEHP